MPSPEQFERYQKAILWPFVKRDAYSNPVVGAPVEILVRWNTVQKTVLAPDGSTIGIDAEVVVNQDIRIDSEMWLGSMEDLAGTGTLPLTGVLSNVMIVKTVSGTPDLKARFNRRTLQLMRKSNTLSARA